MKMKSKMMAILCLAMSTTSWAQPALRAKGYKGFVQANFAIVSNNVTTTDGKFSGRSSSYSLALATSHGMQVCPWLFAGAGVGIKGGGGENAAVMDMDFVQMPFFLQARGYLSRRDIAPYVDFKGGYAVGDMYGGYLSPALGVSVPVARRLALNVELAYQAQNSREEYTWGTEKTWRHFFSLGFGLEF